eukprot:CAMPEP_0197422036 /NCGR_PEP_ID=MMETSP1170-20131217/13011_1 /TAXON_ID=54406 /ORGANISM="Sarcinochrysis sp, Strain CCMP770" /LENGTH=100 /DNA_ID=CAMNT_0042949341 /DNA_START=41 /DNA_END=343 /DNA_ORIENTATION=+
MTSLARRLIPLADRVLVKKIVAQTQTAGGVFLPDANLPKMNEAEVLAVGPGARDPDGKMIPVDVAVGDKVLLPDFGPSPIKIDNEEYHLLRATDILAKFA